MKRSIKFLGAILFASATLTSCGGGVEEKISLPDPPSDLKYESVVLIDGPLSEYVEVVPGSYSLELEKSEDEYLLGYGGTMKVKFKFLKSIDVKAGGGYNNYGPSLNGKSLDQQGVPLGFEISSTAGKDLATYLKRGSGEEWIILNISGQGLCDNIEEAKKQLEQFKKGKKIRFNSEIVEEKIDSESSSSSSSYGEDDDEISSSSTDCDELLEGYEEFMDQYIDMIKKMKNNPGDMSIMTDYASIMTEAGKWSSKTADCAADAKYASKFIAIQMKIANAASGM